jgi:hypothetical protein
MATSKFCTFIVENIQGGGRRTLFYQEMIQHALSYEYKTLVSCLQYAPVVKGVLQITTTLIHLQLHRIEASIKGLLAAWPAVKCKIGKQRAK